MDDLVECVERAKQGDNQAFGDLVRAWHGRVFACCRFFLTSEADADEATQETFVRAHRQVDRLESPGVWGSWLRGIARHVCLDMLRRRGRTSSLAQEAVLQMEDERQPDPAREVMRQDERAQLMFHIDNLPDELREVVLLHYFNQMTYDEMAEWLGVARATVSERLRKSRSRLRQRMTLQGAVDHE